VRAEAGDEVQSGEGREYEIVSEVGNGKRGERSAAHGSYEAKKVTVNIGL